MGCFLLLPTKKDIVVLCLHFYWSEKLIFYFFYDIWLLLLYNYRFHVHKQLFYRCTILISTLGQQN